MNQTSQTSKTGNSQRFHIPYDPALRRPVIARPSFNLPQVDVPQVDLELSALSPYITAMTLHNSRNRKGHLATERHTQPRLVRLYEIEFFIRTGGVAAIDDSQYPISRGDVRFHRPGQIVWSVVHYECYAIRLTLDGSQPQDDSFQPLYRNPVIDPIPSFMRTSAVEPYQDLLDEMLRLSINPQQGTDLLLKARSLELLYLLYKDASQLQTFGSSSRLSDTVTKAMDFMSTRYGEPVRLPDIAAAVNLSPYHFHRLFTRAMSMTPLTYLTRVRIEQARELLLTTQAPVSEVASTCGFENPSYFSRVFRQYVGQTPVLFRQVGQII